MKLIYKVNYTKMTNYNIFYKKYRKYNNLEKIIIPPQIISSNFYRKFDVISQLEFINYYELLVNFSGAQNELKRWLELYGIKFYFINQIHAPKKPNQKVNYRQTKPLHYSKIELLKLRSYNLI